MMCRQLLFFLCFLFARSVCCQTFTSTISGIVPSNNTDVCFPLKVSGVGAINNSTFGLSKVCVNIAHTTDQDLAFFLVSPDGAKVVLSSLRGQTGDNYINTCFTGTATVPIASGSAPFTNTYLPEGYLGNINNGQNADGIWYLCARDVVPTNTGFFQNFSLTFDSTPAPAGPVPNVQDCLAAIPLCRNIYSETVSYAGVGNIANETNPKLSCLLSGEKNSVWYVFTTQTAGDLSFLITPNVLTEDYDWEVYNLTNAKCTDLIYNKSLNVSCNYAGFKGITGPTGASTLTQQGLSGTPFNAKIPVAAGETYVVHVSNYSSTTNGYTIDFGASTAVMFDTSKAFLKSVKPIDKCGTKLVSVQFSENVVCNSFVPTDFTITGPGGPYTVTRLSSSCLTGAPYSNDFTLTVSPALTIGGNYQLCQTSVTGVSADVCANSVLAGCLTFFIDTSLVATFDSLPSICYGSAAPVLPSISKNGLNGIWSPSVVSNTSAATYTFTPTTTACFLPSTLTTNIVTKPFVGNDSIVAVCAGKIVNLSAIYDTTGLMSFWSYAGNAVTRPDSVLLSGVYTFTVSNANNCKDTVKVQVVHNGFNTFSNAQVSICQSQLPFLWNGNNYSSSGVFIDTLINAKGCDSIVTLYLVIANSKYDTTVSMLCTNQLPYLWNGSLYSVAGMYSDTLLSSIGCDSVVTLTLTLKAATASTISISLCPKQLPYIFNGKSYGSAGIFYETLINSIGCDSIVTLNLTLKAATASTLNISLCSKQLPYIFNGKSYGSAGVYKDTLVNAIGCDSVVTLNLTLKVATASTLNISLCPKQLPYIFNGKSYGSAGVFYDTLINSIGCDSVVTLNLTLKAATTSTINISLCPKQLPYIFNGKSYSGAGIFYDTLINSIGCDSIVTLNLTLKAATANTLNISLCSMQLPYFFNGKSYSGPGIFYDTLINSIGCDSVVSLNLTLKAVTASTLNISLCPKQLPYIINGKSYGSAGVYKDTLVNAAGCDSVVTLVLSVRNISTSKTLVSICSNDLPYLWNGQSLVNAGIFSSTLIDRFGCDSLATIELTIKTSPTAPGISSNSPVCQGTNLMLMAVAATGQTYRWIGPNNFNSAVQNPVIAMVDTNYSGNYAVTVFSNGCTSTASNIQVTIFPIPKVTLSPTVKVYEGDSLKLSPIGTTVDLRYKWTPSTFFISPDSIRSPLLIPLRTITYYLNISTDKGCKIKENQIIVNVLPRVKPIKIPNAFSPNGDGINDVWMIKDLAGNTETSVEVFDRNGRVVFSSIGNFKGWDGRFNGRTLPHGTYYYIIKVKRGEQPITGWIALLK